VPAIDPDIRALPLDEVADAALGRARALGAQHAEVRVERVRSRQVALRDTALAGLHDGEDVGVAVRVVHDGTWGFAASPDVCAETAVALAEQAVALARLARPLRDRAVELAPEPVHHGEWVSAFTHDPFEVDPGDVVALLQQRSEMLLRHPAVAHTTASLAQVHEATFYADLAGTSTRQQRVRVAPEIEVLGLDADAGTFETMRSLAAPAGRGYEYVTGEDGVHDWDAEVAELPELLAQRLRAPSVEPGRYDLVIDPTNLWLTIHESIGHATELDRALGYEANYAGTSFATPDQLGTLRYGSPLLDVTADRTMPHGLATVGWDHEGVHAQRWPLVRKGVLVGYQTDRWSATLLQPPTASHGCAFAQGPSRVPLQRMANVSIDAAPGGPTTEQMIASVQDGLYVVGDKSWSIDMQRYNFQFTAQRFYRIKDGRLAGQVRDAAYQGRTPEFWGALDAVGGADSWWLGGTFVCGKAQPGQTAPVSHGSPAVLVRGVNVLNTAQEGSHG
jgi:TldD protein